MDSRSLETAQRLIEEGRYFEACAAFPTDLCHLRPLIQGIDTHSKETAACWLNTLLKNPFDMSKLLRDEEYETLVDYLFAQLAGACYVVRKILLKDIALILSHRAGRLAEGVLHEDNYFTVAGHRISEIDFWNLINQISKLNKEIKALFFNGKIRVGLKPGEGDSVCLKRHKIKIISHLSTRETAKGDAEWLLGLMSFEDAKLGWTLSKAVFRISRFLEKRSIIGTIQKMIGGDVFGDEQLWINALTILGLFVLHGDAPSDISFVQRALLHDKEFAPKSINLRETALFFVWCCARSGYAMDLAAGKGTGSGKENDPGSNRSDVTAACADDGRLSGLLEGIIRTVVIISLFDRDFKCRRAAAALLDEFVGRCAEERLVALFGNQMAGIALIDQASVKRADACVEIFKRLEYKEKYRAHVTGMLYHYTRTVREQAAVLIAQYYDASEVEARYETLPEIDGYNLLVYHNNRENKEKIFVEKAFDAGSLLKVRNGECAVQSYLKICAYADGETLKRCLLFLINRNSNFCDEIADAVHHLRGDAEFCRTIFALANKNECALIANSQNSLFSEKFAEICKKNLATRKNAVATIRALRRHDSDLRECVVAFLDDYTVDAGGDTGYFLRRESLLYMLARGYCTSIEQYLIRFAADKSKRLRDEIMCYLLSGQFGEFVSDFSYLGQARAQCGYIHHALLHSAAQFKEFFIKHRELAASVSNDEAYFTALFHAFGTPTAFGNKDFMIGIISTLSTASRTLFDIVSALVRENAAAFIDTAMDLVHENSAFLFPALHFFLLLKELKISFPVQQLLEKAMTCRLRPKEQEICNEISSIYHRPCE